MNFSPSLWSTLWFSASYSLSDDQKCRWRAMLQSFVKQLHTAVNVHKFSSAEVDHGHAMEKNVGSDDNVFTQREQRVHCNDKWQRQFHSEYVKQLPTVPKQDTLRLRDTWLHIVLHSYYQTVKLQPLFGTKAHIILVPCRTVALICTYCTYLCT